MGNYKHFFSISTICVHLLLQNGLSAEYLLVNNFEDNSLDPWEDQSSNGAEWTIVDYDDDANDPLNIPRILPPSSGNRKYLAVKFKRHSFGIAALKLREPFAIAPGTTLTLMFFIRSRYGGLNNVEVVE